MLFKTVKQIPENSGSALKMCVDLISRQQLYKRLIQP